ncbi:diaminopropionate ammonia-lyase [Klebsiella sp. NPDC088457]
MQLHINASDRRLKSYNFEKYVPFGAEHLGEIKDLLQFFEYAETPLFRLKELANSLGVAEIYIKDEGQRSSLRSFKTLGGAHAVIRLLLAVAEDELGRAVPPAEVYSKEVRDVASRITISCATDGNHGRAVAAAAARLGCKAVIFIHKGVSERRAAAIREQGAEVIRVNGSYDDSVEFTTRNAAEKGWHVVSDTSWAGYETIPTWVMQGYLPMADEMVRQIADAKQNPTHIFLQAGVGGFAAAVAAHLHTRLGRRSPKVIVVEPDKAACVYFSSINNRNTRVEESAPTVMGMLECYESSLVAWDILEQAAEAFITVSDEDALRAMARLATPLSDDPAMCGGESGGAGLAGLQACVNSARARELLGLESDSVVLLINTEGATDEVLYSELLSKGRELL